jgi:uncharacterized membrane protein YeaQ/YmgE (transglycosylase-associated protein family)
MGLILTLILGGLAGWVASLIVGNNKSMGLVLNIVVGIVGAFVANLLIAPLVDTSAQLDTLSLSGFLMSVLGAVVLLLVVNAVRAFAARNRV